MHKMFFENQKNLKVASGAGLISVSLIFDFTSQHVGMMFKLST